MAALFRDSTLGTLITMYVASKRVGLDNNIEKLEAGTSASTSSESHQQPSTFNGEDKIQVTWNGKGQILSSPAHSVPTMV
jgi:hypothetical protein